jgi:hypothetical protein
MRFDFDTRGMLISNGKSNNLRKPSIMVPTNAYDSFNNHKKNEPQPMRCSIRHNELRTEQ